MLTVDHISTSELRSKMADSSYLVDFGGSPTPDASRHIHLPSHRDLSTPLDDDALTDALSPPIQTNRNRDGDGQFLLDTYARACHPALDDLSGDALDDTLAALEHCHTGLRRARNAECLEAENIYNLANRLVTWLQDDPRARLGPLSDGKWWIAHDVYLVRAGRLSSSGVGAYRDGGMPVLSDPNLLDWSFYYGDRTGDKDRFERALFTAHIVHFTGVEHWALIIRQKSTGNTWYIDSNPCVELSRRSLKALMIFKDRLRRSGISDPEGAVHKIVVSTKQDDDWSCGLHVIANIMAFIRFEVPRWNEIHGWGGINARQMRKQLLSCLHSLMGLRLPVDFVSPRPPTWPRQTRRSTRDQTRARQELPKPAAKSTRGKKSPGQAGGKPEPAAPTKPKIVLKKPDARAAPNTPGAPTGTATQESTPRTPAEAQADPLTSAERRQGWAIKHWRPTEETAVTVVQPRERARSAPPSLGATGLALAREERGRDGEAEPGAAPEIPTQPAAEPQEDREWEAEPEAASETPAQPAQPIFGTRRAPRGRAIVQAARALEAAEAAALEARRAQREAGLSQVPRVSVKKAVAVARCATSALRVRKPPGGVGSSPYQTRRRTAKTVRFASIIATSIAAPTAVDLPPTAVRRSPLKRKRSAGSPDDFGAAAQKRRKTRISTRFGAGPAV